jgi:hypothetical protein
MNLLNNCQVPIYLAYLMAAYSLASFFYIVASRNIGTPLRDSYTAEQIEIKKDSSYIRGKIFYYSLFIAIILLYLIKPFHKCLN